MMDCHLSLLIILPVLATSIRIETWDKIERADFSAVTTFYTDALDNAMSEEDCLTRCLVVGSHAR